MPCDRQLLKVGTFDFILLKELYFFVYVPPV